MIDYNNREGREKRRDTAFRHTEDMHERYKSEIKQSIARSVIYGGNGKTPQKSVAKNAPQIVFRNKDTVSAIIEARQAYPGKKIAALNFASYKNPGGMFISGAIAQEEALCHKSYLYNVLFGIPEYYAYNNERKNRALYTDRAIYSPDIVFEHEGEKAVVDVITCACPNKGAAKRYCHVGDEENRQILKERICFIKNIAEEQMVDCLILGAFGCGVFRQNPEEVANVFKEVFAASDIKVIIMAVPGGGKNPTVFRNIFGKKSHE